MDAESVPAPRLEDASTTIEITARLTVPRADLEELRGYLTQELRAITAVRPDTTVRVQPWSVAAVDTASLGSGARLRIEASAREVFRDDAQLLLTRMEFDLLLYLAERPKRVHDRGSLLRAVWGCADAVSGRNVDVHVRRLRKKLGPGLDLITTVRGVGYRFDGVHEVSIDRGGLA